MTVQHVHVAKGGQVIIGDVSAPALGVGRARQPRNNPMLGRSSLCRFVRRCDDQCIWPGIEVPRQVEAEQVQCRASAVREF